MTKAQEVKKALKGIYNIVSCTGGTGTAYGWVSLTIRTNKKYGSNHDLMVEIENHIKKAGVKLYNFTSNDGYDTKMSCMNVQVERGSK